MFRKLSVTLLIALLGLVLVSAQEDDQFTTQTVGLVESEIQASNGVIYIIDAVMLPPDLLEMDESGAAMAVLPEATPEMTPEMTPEATPEATEEPATSETTDMETIWGLVRGRDDLTTLAMAIETLEMVEFFDDTTGEYTVFAPTDAAFEAFLERFDLTADEIMQADNETLEDVLTLHVAQEIITSEDLQATYAVTPFGGEIFEMTLDAEALFINMDAGDIGEE